MSIAQQPDLRQYCLQVARRAKQASGQLPRLSGAQKNEWLRQSARMLSQNTPLLLDANQRDVRAAPEFGLTSAQVDRLRLTPERIESMTQGLEQIAMLPDPIGAIVQSSVRPNGLLVSKVRVPLGVVFFIYESRPNVTADAAALCAKSGNAVILRGGKEAAHSSQAIVETLIEAAASCQMPEYFVQLVQTRDRAAVGHLLALNQYIDVAIPRGGEGLIRRVAAEATMPVIKHFDGNCHVYVDRDAAPDMAEQIVVNSKCQRMGVCNAAESLIVHAAIADQVLPRIGSALSGRGVEIRGDRRTCQLLTDAVPATEQDLRAEFLGPVISSVVVDSLDEAIEHINRYGSGHTDAIVTESLSAAREFATRVDSSAVMVNASTRFNDGGQLGLGAEIGISTDKFHARGPCGLNELTSYKYVIQGSGQVL